MSNELEMLNGNAYLCFLYMYIMLFNVFHNRAFTFNLSLKNKGVYSVSLGCLFVLFVLSDWSVEESSRTLLCMCSADPFKTHRWKPSHCQSAKC